MEKIKEKNLTHTKIPKRILHKILTPAFGCTMFIIVTYLAMLTYSGGTSIDPNTLGYTFSENFFSDLGHVSAWSGAPNTASQILFFIAATGCGLMLIPFYISMSYIFNENDRQILLNKVGSRLAVISSLGYASIGITPADVLNPLHLIAVIIAFGGSLPVVFIYVYLMLSHSDYPRILALILGFFGLILILYLVVIVSFADASIISHLRMQVIGQKVVVYSEMIMSIILSTGTWKYLKSRN